MQALTAGLAFGITMFVLATVVSSLVETLHRLVGLREKGLALLLGNFYDRVIATRATDMLRGGEDRRRFIDMMTANRGPVGGVRMPAFLGKLLRLDTTLGDRRFLNWIWSGRRLGSLGATAFMERLGGSEYGASLVMQASSSAGALGTEWMLKDLAQKFDAYGAEASQYFESRARLLSVLVGFVMAFAINVNALVLFETFLARPEVALTVIDSQDKLQTRVDALNAAVAKIPPASPGAPAPSDSADAQAVRLELQRTQAALEEVRTQANASVGSLKEMGVPIGWKDWDEFQTAIVSGTPILGLLLGGLLIGLGAPFWYKVVQNLTAVRALVGGKESDKSATTASAPAAPPGPTETPTTPIEAFHAALGATLAAGELSPPEEAVG